MAEYLTSTPVHPPDSLHFSNQTAENAGWHRLSTASNEAVSPLKPVTPTTSNSKGYLQQKTSATLPARLPVGTHYSIDEHTSSPVSHTTNNSFRSPTAWTAFEDSEEGIHTDDADDNVSNASSNNTGVSAGCEEHLNDMETRNLLDEAEGMSIGEEDLYVEMSPDQKKYYLSCFELLQKQTQGNIDRGGALRGSDEKVTEFFRKSQLDTNILSKIWALSDVNGDGYLNLSEFSTAMHLIVLHKKGGVPVPDYLPDHLQPPVTPTRDGDADSTSSSARPSPSIRLFSNVPSTDPSLERPVALKADNPMTRSFHETSSQSQQLNSPPAASLPLSPGSGPRGPPPKPPPRPPRSHARSASLDLTKKETNLHLLIDTSATNKSLEMNEENTKRESIEAETQTDTDTTDTDQTDVGIDRQRYSHIFLHIDQHTSVEDDVGVAGRCARLKLLNRELESERVRLQHIRMALEQQCAKYS